jgi:hypothetical protein
VKAFDNKEYYGYHNKYDYKTYDEALKVYNDILNDPSNIATSKNRTIYLDNE